MAARHAPRTAPIAACLLLAWTAAGALEVGITAEIASVTVEHAGAPVVIRRDQDRRNTVTPYYAFTSRPCPPFCIQPITIAPGVETVGELEVLGYLERRTAGDRSVLVVDARRPRWIERGMIPGAVNVPWTALDPAQASPAAIREVLRTRFGVAEENGFLSFAGAKTLVLYCNGMWCSQSGNIVRSLLDLGYPAHRLKWYRGGMQGWETVGLTTVRGTP